MKNCIKCYKYFECNFYFFLVGTYGAKDKLHMKRECTDCPSGKYCEGTGLDTWSGECQEGYYCLGRSSKKAPDDGVTGMKCPPGYYIKFAVIYLLCDFSVIFEKSWNLICCRKSFFFTKRHFP